MTALSNIHRRLAVAGAAVASAALAVGGILQLTDEQSGQTTVVGVEHVTLGAFTVTLIALIPVVLAFAQIAGRVWPGRIATAGLVVLAALTTISNVRGEDPSFFPPVAVVSNLLIVAGLIALAVTLTRSGRFPKALAIALPVSLLACGGKPPAKKPVVDEETKVEPPHKETEEDRAAKRLEAAHALITEGST